MCFQFKEDSEKVFFLQVFVKCLIMATAKTVAETAENNIRVKVTHYVNPNRFYLIDLDYHARTIGKLEQMERAFPTFVANASDEMTVFEPKANDVRTIDCLVNDRVISFIVSACFVLLEAIREMDSMSD